MSAQSEPAGLVTQTESVGNKPFSSAEPPSTGAAPPQTNVSIGARMLLATAWMIFGLVFFYLVMVFLSAMSKSIVLDRLPAHGWTRTASRHTAAVAVFPLAAFLLCDKSKRRSLFFAVMLACALFCHFVIITSDARVYTDDEIMEQMLHKEKTHPLMGMFGSYSANLWRALGSLGFVASLFLAMERTYGPALGQRKEELPMLAKAATWWIVQLNVVTYVDHLLGVMVKGDREIADVLYPIYFLVLLFVSATYYYADTLTTEPQTAQVNLAEKKDE